MGCRDLDRVFLGGGWGLGFGVLGFWAFGLSGFRVLGLRGLGLRGLGLGVMVSGLWGRVGYSGA